MKAIRTDSRTKRHDEAPYSSLLIFSLSTFLTFAQNDCQFDATIRPPNCNNENGRIAINPVRGMPPYEFKWSENTSTKNSATARKLSSGIYGVTISDAAACVQTDTFILQQAERPVITGAVLPFACDAQTGGLRIDVVDVDSSATYYYSVNGLTYHFSNIFNNIQPGSHTLYAKTDNSCIDSTKLFVPFPEALTVDLGDDQIVSLGDSVELGIYSVGDQLLKLRWSPSAGLSCTDCPQPTVKITDTQTFTLMVTDSMGCTATDKIQIFVQKDRNVYVPTAFSPNADGINDHFVLFTGEGVTELRDLLIYGRWGNLLHAVKGSFPGNSVRFGWDGKISGQRVAAGTYVYQFITVFQDGAEELYQGTVRVVR